jgi:predicted DNA-binding transcriptional regulator AlpA
MQHSPPPITPRYLRTPDAATHLGLSPRTLEKHRCYGTGPVFRRLGGRVVYAIEELEAWAAQGSRRSTSDPGTGTIQPALPGRGDPRDGAARRR